MYNAYKILENNYFVKYTNLFKFSSCSQRLNPYERGIKVSNFPAPPTRPPVKSPSPCVWAVVHCCPSKVNRLITCFESMGCPGINWDPSPCRTSITQAAKNQVAKFYAETEERDEYDYP